MTKEENFTIYLSATDRGTFLAATRCSPYFCLEAPSEQAVKDLVKRALIFRAKNQDKLTPSKTIKTSVTRFQTKTKIKSGELADA